jgi:hypothetical protein
MKRIFVHLAPFERAWSGAGLTDHKLRLLQLFLLYNPDCGDIIKGTHGIRKLRWSEDGRGKRGGLRIFFIDFPAVERTYLITLLRKSDAADLSSNQRKILSALVLELKRKLAESKSRN